MNKKIIFGMFVFLFVIVISSQLISAYLVEKGNKCYCASCYECMHALNYKDCHTIILKRDIDISSGTGAYAKFNNGNCINNPKGFSGKTLDCQGYKIIGEKKKGFGIYLEDKNGNTIKNCQIINFNTGILLSSSNNSHILSNNISRNSHGAWLGYSCEDNFSNNNIFENTLGIQLISSNNSHISGNDIYDNEECGVWLVDSSGNTVSGNDIYDNKGCCGVWLNSSSGNAVSGNGIYGNREYGVRLVDSSGNNVSGNNISYNDADGVLLDASSGNTVSGNNIYDNEECGVWLFDFSNNNTVSGNDIYSNELDGVCLFDSSNNTVSGNYINYNNADGVLLNASSGNTVSGNDIYSNELDGVLLNASSGNTVSGNNIYDNEECGVWLYFSTNNLIYNNYFSGNHPNVKVKEPSGNMWNVTKKRLEKGTNIIGGEYLGGNYWSDYTGKDTDGDGLGDTLYYIISNEDKDYLPLVKSGESGNGGSGGNDNCVSEGGSCSLDSECCSGNCDSSHCCPSDRPVWDGSGCVECLSDDDCDSGYTCDVSSHTCVESGGSGDSGGNDNCVSEGGSCSLDSECCSGNCDSSHCCPSDRPVWDGSGCVECLSDDDCSGSTPVCNLTSHTCVASGSGNSGGSDEGGSGGGDKCGNGKIDGKEVCDGTNLNGKTCKDFKDKNGNYFTGGTLLCKEDCSGFDTGKCYVKKPQYVYNTSKYSNSIIYKTSCSQISKGHSRFSTSGTCEKYNKCTKDNSAVLDFICYNTTKISQGVYKGNHCTSYAVENTVNSSLIDVSSIFGSADTGKVRVLNCSGSWGKGHCEVTDGVAHCCMEADQKCDDAHPCCSGLTCNNGKCSKSPSAPGLGISGKFDTCFSSKLNNGQEEKYIYFADSKELKVSGEVELSNNNLKYIYVCCNDKPDGACTLSDKFDLTPTDENNKYKFNASCDVSNYHDVYVHIGWYSGDKNQPLGITYLSNLNLPHIFILDKPCDNEFGIHVDYNYTCYGDNALPFEVSIPHPLSGRINLSLNTSKGANINGLTYKICNISGECSVNHSITLSGRGPFKFTLMLNYSEKTALPLNFTLYLSDQSGNILFKSKKILANSFCPDSGCVYGRQGYTFTSDEPFPLAKDHCCSNYTEKSGDTYSCFYGSYLKNITKDGDSSSTFECEFNSESFNPASQKCTAEGVIPLHEMNCGNGKDDDKDGLTDCLDPDCYTKPSTFNWMTYAKEHVHSTQDCVPSIPDAYPGCGVAQCGQDIGKEHCYCWISQPVDGGQSAEKRCLLLRPESNLPSLLKLIEKYHNYQDKYGSGIFCIDRKYLNDGVITVKVNGKEVTEKVQGICSATPGLDNVLDRNGNPEFCGSCNMMRCKIKIKDSLPKVEPFSSSGQTECGGEGESCCLSGCDGDLTCCYSNDNRYPLGVCEKSCSTDQSAIQNLGRSVLDSSKGYISGSLISGKCFYLKLDGAGKITEAYVWKPKNGDLTSCDEGFPPSGSLVYANTAYFSKDEMPEDLSSQISNIINQYVSFLQQKYGQTLAGDLLKNPGFEQGSKFWTLSGNAEVDSVGGVDGSKSLKLNGGSAYQRTVTEFSVGDTFVLSAQRAVSDNNCKITFKVGMFDPNKGDFVNGKFSSKLYESKSSGGFSDVRYTIKKEDISKGYVLAVGISTSGCTAWVDNLLLKKSSERYKQVVGYQALCGPSNELNTCNQSQNLVCRLVNNAYRCVCDKDSVFENGKCSLSSKEVKSYNLLTNGDFSQVDKKGHAKFWQPDFEPKGYVTLQQKSSLPYIIHDPIHLDVGTYLLEFNCDGLHLYQYVPVYLIPQGKEAKSYESFLTNNQFSPVRSYYDPSISKCVGFIYIVKPGEYILKFKATKSASKFTLKNVSLLRVPRYFYGQNNLVKCGNFDTSLPEEWKLGSNSLTVGCALGEGRGLKLLESKSHKGAKYTFSNLNKGFYTFTAYCHGHTYVLINFKTRSKGKVRSFYPLSLITNSSGDICAANFYVGDSLAGCSDPMSYFIGIYRGVDKRFDLFPLHIDKSSGCSKCGEFNLTLSGQACVDNVVVEPQSDFVKDINEYYKKLEEGAKHDQQGGEDQQENKNNEQGKNDNNQQGNDNQQGEGETGKGDKDEETNPESLSVDVCHYETYSENGKNKYFVVSDGKLYSCSKLNSQSVPENDFSDCSLVSNACPDSYNVVKVVSYDGYTYSLCRKEKDVTYEFCRFNGEHKPNCYDFKKGTSVTDFSIAKGKVFFAYSDGSEYSIVSSFLDEKFPSSINLIPIKSLESSTNLFTHVLYNGSVLYFSQKQENDDSTYLIKMYSGGKISPLKTVNKLVTCIKKVDGVVKYFTASSSKPVFDSESKSVAGGGLNVVK